VLQTPKENTVSMVEGLSDKELEKVKLGLQIKIEQTNLEVSQYALHRVKMSLRPSMYFPVTISWDDVRSEWKCQHALIDEAVGFGKSPNDAMVDFDYVWLGIKGEGNE